MRSSEFVMRRGWLRCHVVWFEWVVWGELEDDLVIRTTQIYSVLHSTTKYYSSTTIVLHTTTPVLLCTTKYYSSTTPVLLCAAKYHSVLQSTTPVLLWVGIECYHSCLIRSRVGGWILDPRTPGDVCHANDVRYDDVEMQIHLRG